MKIAFFNIGLGHSAFIMFSAMAKKEGHTVELIHASTLFRDGLTREFKPLSRLFNTDKEAFNELKHFQPDVIAFSVLTYHYKLAIYYAEHCKRICPDAKIIFGGIHVSAVPELVIANEFIDYVVIGEGDVAFPEIIKRIEEGNFPDPIVNTWFKAKNKTIIKSKQAGFIQDLDSPNDVELYLKLNPPTTVYYPTMTSRGCPYNCSYCFNHFFRNIPEEKSNYIRHQSVEHVIEELTTNKNRLKFKTIEFWDDIFTLDKKWLKEFLEAYKKEVSLPFKCYIHVDLFDEETAIMLKDAGCKWADFGIQTVNEEYRKKYLNRHGTNANIIKTLKLLKKYKIVSFADYIVGLPGDTIENFEEARFFFLENMPDIIEPYWMQYHPKTEIIEKAVELNILDNEKINLINLGYNNYNYYESCFGAQDFHNQYYLMLKVLPSLPVFLRKKLTYKVSQKIPYFIKVLIYIYSIVYSTFKHDNLRVKFGAAAYLSEMFRILKLKYFSKKRF